MENDINPETTMAEDTRLADACLLLNFPNQSFREQQLLFEQSKNATSKEQTETPDSSDTSEDPQLASSDNPSSTSSLAASITNLREAQLDQSDSTITLQKTNFADSNSPKEKASVSCSQTPDAGRTRDPISNLLAAVNCALPGVRTLPNILQRSSTNNLSPRSTAILSSPPDHDYCQKSIDQRNEGSKTITSGLISRDRGKSNSLYESSSSGDNQKFETLNSAPDRRRPLKIVAVHLGAGYGSGNPELLRFAKNICQEVMLRDTATADSRTLRRKRKQTCNSSSFDGLNRKCKCQQMPTMDSCMTAEAAVVQLVKYMEDNQALNCGYGSNLNLNGQVECDASLMSDRFGMWAGIGAVSGCKNPILLAKTLYDHREIHRPLGLVQPNLLVGSGAKQWMREHCPNLSVMDSKMLSSKSFSTYQKLKSSYDASIRSLNEQSTYSCNKQAQSNYLGASSSNIANSSTVCSTLLQTARHSPVSLDHGFYCLNNMANSEKFTSSIPLPVNGVQSMREPTPEPLDDDKLNSETQVKLEPGIYSRDSSQQFACDTVGAVAVDSDNNFACAISSGGLLLKYKGRVGQAAVPGAGCWSESSVAVTSTGVGEYLTQNMFAKKFHDKLQTLRLLYDLGHVEMHSDPAHLISCCMEECFEDLLNSTALKSVPQEDRLAGMLSVSSFNTKTNDENLYLTYAHNTSSMCIGYMTCDDILGHSFISRRKDEKRDGRPLVKTLTFSPDYKVFL